MKKQKEQVRVKQRGQVTVEYILLAVVMIAAFQAGTKALQKWKLLEEFQDLPAEVFRHMVENGNLETNEPTSRRKHPNYSTSQYTPEGTGSVNQGN